MVRHFLQTQQLICLSEGPEDASEKNQDNIQSTWPKISGEKYRVQQKFQKLDICYFLKDKYI